MSIWVFAAFTHTSCKGMRTLFFQRVLTPSFSRSAESLGSSPGKKARVSMGSLKPSAEDKITGHPRLKFYTRSCRLEMYVSEDLWQRLDR